MAATDLLSDKAIQAAIKAAVADVKPKKISDGGGLLLIARPTGTGWWRMRYWIDSKEGMMSLGTRRALIPSVITSKKIRRCLIGTCRGWRHESL